MTHRKLCFAFFAAGAALLAQVIEGTVTNSVTGAPVASVAVTVEASGKPAYQSTTDEQGAFRISDVKPGSYAASFTKDEFLQPDRNSPARRPFSVGTRSDPIRIQVLMTPFGKISGRVFAGRDQPVPKAELYLDDGKTGQTKSTDQQGAFSFQVAPGAYTVSVRAPRDLKPPAPDGDQRLGWIPTYYPGVSEPQATVKISVGPGAELWGQDITVLAAPVHRVGGVIFSPAGDPAPGVAVSATPSDQLLPEEIETVSGADGSYEFAALRRGEWRIFAEGENAGVKLRAFVVERVTNRDIDRVELRLSPPFTVTGSISVLEPAGTKFTDRVGVFLKPLVPASEGFNQGISDRNGALKIDKVYPGSYKIVAYPAPPYYLSSITLGNQDVLGEYVTFSSGATPFQVILDAKSGGVRGKVEDCGAATIVLSPQDRALQEPQFVRTAQCGDSGRFELSGLRPGDYYAFAFDRWNGPVELIANFDQYLANKSVTVHVGRGEVAAVELKVTSRTP